MAQLYRIDRIFLSWLKLNRKEKPTSDDDSKILKAVKTKSEVRN